MTATASPQQLTALQQLKPGPLVLFCEYSFADAAQSDACTRAIASAAKRYGGALRWTGSEENVVCGKISLYQRAASLHFHLRDGARGFIESRDWNQALARATACQVSVVAEQPKVITVVSYILSKLMPIWPFDNTIEDGEEPGDSTSTTMPSADVIADIRSHADQASPVTMINWLKFREKARYEHEHGAPISGKDAYMLYGRIALTATHSLGAKLLHAARYLMILVGNGGDPGRGLWDEFALMQYPGRATFGRMAQLKRYRAGLPHRAAGLEEYGQGLTLTRPAPEFTWKR